MKKIYIQPSSKLYTVKVQSGILDTSTQNLGGNADTNYNPEGSGGNNDARQSFGDLWAVSDDSQDNNSGW